MFIAIYTKVISGQSYQDLILEEVIFMQEKP